MSHWVLRCKNCAKRFPYSPTAPQPDRPEFLYPRKPEFPDGGENAACPHCHGSALYQRHQLIIQLVKRTVGDDRPNSTDARYDPGSLQD
jgi:hypothetical protein